MKKDEKNEEKKRMNPWFYAIFWLLRQKLARGLRFWQTTLSFLKVPRTVASPHPSILPNTDLIKATLSSFAKVP